MTKEHLIIKLDIFRSKIKKTKEKDRKKNHMKNDDHKKKIARDGPPFLGSFVVLYFLQRKKTALSNIKTRAS